MEKASPGDKKNACEQRRRDGPGPRGVRTWLPVVPEVRPHPHLPMFVFCERGVTLELNLNLVKFKINKGKLKFTGFELNSGRLQTNSASNSFTDLLWDFLGISLVICQVGAGTLVLSALSVTVLSCKSQTPL